jgi:hypothetical protein
MMGAFLTVLVPYATANHFPLVGLGWLNVSPVAFTAGSRTSVMTESTAPGEAKRGFTRGVSAIHKQKLYIICQIFQAATGLFSTSQAWNFRQVASNSF